VGEPTFGRVVNTANALTYKDAFVENEANVSLAGQTASIGSTARLSLSHNMPTCHGRSKPCMRGVKEWTARRPRPRIWVVSGRMGAVAEGVHFS